MSKKKKGDGNSSLMFVLYILIHLTNFLAPYPPIFVIPVTSILLFIFHVHLYYQAYFFFSRSLFFFFFCGGFCDTLK